MLPTIVGRSKGIVRSTSINIFAITDGDHVDESVVVVDLIEHAIVTNSNPPECIVSAQLLTAAWSRVGAPASRSWQKFELRLETGASAAPSSPTWRR
jgi:hypothetical protein